MQIVSSTYKQEIARMDRHRGHIRVTIGVINQTAQSSATVINSQNSLAYYSIQNADSTFETSNGLREYVSDEKDWSKVDGSMYFVPQQSEGMDYHKCGIVNNTVINHANSGGICITFNGVSDLDIKGLSIDFGENYPTGLEIETNVGTTTYTNLTSRYFSTEDNFNGISYFILRQKGMANNTGGRLRIYSFNFGLSNTFSDGDIEDFDSKEYVSPITDSVPSRDMNVTINNRNQYFSPDNPDSTIAYMEVGQKMTVQFGYDLDREGSAIEWLPEITAYLTEWGATDSTATFTATDKFYSLTGMYYKGLYRPSGISLYELAEDIFRDAEVEGYYIDEYLRNVIVYNPIPPVNHASALQIVANTGRCVLFEDRSGGIFIKSSFKPAITATSNGEPEYSNVANIVKSGEKDAYGIDSNNFTHVDDTMYFVGENGDYRETGYYSNSIYMSEPMVIARQLPTAQENFTLVNPDGGSEIEGTWSDGEPVITLTLEAIYSSYGLNIQFREQYARKFRVQTYNSGTLIDDRTYDNTSLYFTTTDVFLTFDVMVITFLVGYSKARVTIDSIALGDMTDYVIKRDKMISSPTAVRQRRIKAINVAKEVYSPSGVTEELSHETISVSSADPEYYIYLSDPCYNFHIDIVTSGVTAVISESSSYYVKITFSGLSTDKMVEYSLTGCKYTITKTFISKNYHYDGEEITWSNPLVSNSDLAEDIAEWLSTFYLGDVQYDVTWVGDPRIDANDLLYLELKDRGNTLVRAYQNEISYNGAWRGNIQARKAVLDGSEN